MNWSDLPWHLGSQLGPQAAQRFSWGAWILLLVSGLAVMAAAGVSLHGLLAERAVLAHQLAAAEPVRLATPQVASDKADFVATLPAAVAAGEAVAELQRASAVARVTLASVSVSQQAAAASTLGRVDLEFRIQGPYPSIKRVLAQMLGRFDSATVRSLQLRQETGATEAEAHVLFSVWSRPVVP